jgi:hypothetical protein
MFRLHLEMNSAQEIENVKKTRSRMKNKKNKRSNGQEASKIITVRSQHFVTVDQKL